MTNFPPVTELLPHAPPMIVVDDLSNAGDEWVESTTCVRPEHPLFDTYEDGLPGWALIELMAQTIALHAGFLGRQNAQEPRIGYLLGTRRFELQRTVCQAGERIRIHAKREFHDPEGVSAYQCTAFENDDIIATAKLNVYRQPQDNGEASE